MEWLLYAILIGAVAGWLAGQIFKGYGFGLIGNIVIGILGGIIGSWVCTEMGFSLGSGIVGSILTAVLGAILLLLAAGFVKRLT